MAKKDSKESAEELIERIVSHKYTAFHTLPSGKWFYVKQIKKAEYDRIKG